MWVIPFTFADSHSDSQICKIPMKSLGNSFLLEVRKVSLGDDGCTCIDCLWTGWMYYNKEHLGDRASRMEKAVQLLLKAIETDPNSGAAWYLIGRWVEMIVCTKHNEISCSKWNTSHLQDMFSMKRLLMLQLYLSKQGFWYFAKKKQNFAGFSGANSRKNWPISREKKSKFADQSADFRRFSREKSQNLQENWPISRDFSGKESIFEGFSGANNFLRIS